MTQNKIDKLLSITSEVNSAFGRLNVEQLNWKPSQDKWSIAECLQHLITSNETYFPILDKLALGYTPSFWEKYNPFSRSIGRSMINTLGIKISKKFKSPKIFKPKETKYSQSILKNFSDHQEILMDKMNQLKHLDGKKIILSSPVSPLITLPLSDCLEVLSTHEERHLNQAKNIMALSAFPKL